MKLISALVLFGSAFLNTEGSHSRTYTEVYSWRDYYGIVPHDAVAAGYDLNNKPVYIGQALYDKNLIAGKIVEGDDKIYFEYFDKEYAQDKNVKILVSHQPEKLKWVSTNSTDAANLATKRTLIRGGSEPNCVTYIGRLPPVVNGLTNVGKVMCCEVDSCYGLYTTEHGAGKLYQAFEVLSYVEDKPNTVVKITTNGSEDNRQKFSVDIVFD